MDDVACPRCKTTKYRNPSLKLMVNACGHALCENCVDLLFLKGSGSCPECGTALRRNNFRLQLFEDSNVEKEVDIRKRILRDFNKKEEDFVSLNDYNDYLEEIEHIIYNLTNNINVENTKQKIEQYKRENKIQILKNKNKLSREQEFLEEMIEREQHETSQRKHFILKEEEKEKNLKLKKKESLINELMFSDAPASRILASHAVSIEKEVLKPPAPPEVQFSTGIRFRQPTNFLPIQKQENPLFTYTEIVSEICGPALPAMKQLSDRGYLHHIRSAAEDEKAGGFVSDLACYRALQEAMCGLFSPH